MSAVVGDSGKSENEPVELLFDIQVQEETYFPTQIYSYQLPPRLSETLCSSLLKQIYLEREEDREGLERSNQRELGGWHSEPDLHHKKVFKPVIDLVNAMCSRIAAQNAYDEEYVLTLNAMWSIINPPGCANRAHIHPGNLWSGVFYVQTPENCGEIEFIDPRTPNLMHRANYCRDKPRPKNCWTDVYYTPKAGKCLIFPSWLYHFVAPNLSKEVGAAAERVILSFNIDQEEK